MTTAPRRIGLNTAIKRILKVFSSFLISSFNSSLIDLAPFLQKIIIVLLQIYINKFKEQTNKYQNKTFGNIIVYKKYLILIVI